ncbi:Uma2 family endonuclease [Streptomyces sp. NPDC046203]|uniref:Uma2 family endonuclease n=1 Tax=Streptomyces sp. NPDC046203 TaxID=3154602 RepID=UPI0033CCDAD4
MSALAAEAGPEQGNGWDDLVRRWESMDWPEGCKVEIVEGIITVAPLPTVQHGSITAKVHRWLIHGISEEVNVYQSLALAIPERSSLYVPDLVVVPEAAVDQATGSSFPAEVAELVVEVTSKGNAHHDRVRKLRGYAAGGVPLYLLIDRWVAGRPTATLYGEPKNGLYRVLEVVEFGEKIRLPAPFDLTLDTSEFPVD